MPSVVQTQTLNSVGFMLKERPGDPIVSPFTAVNARPSPPSPPGASSMNGMGAEPAHVRPYPHPHSEQAQDQKHLPSREQWASPSTLTENERYTVSPDSDGRDQSSYSPPKRKRSGSAEDEHPFHSPTGVHASSRPRVGSYPSPGNSPPTAHPASMEHQQLTLPPMSHIDQQRNWPPQDSQDTALPNSQYREAPDVKPVPTPHENCSIESEHSHHHHERSSTTEVTRAGVHHDPKKRKRQFANRTKTGCGTCRKRKKKCDEAKPECNNCLRGGFDCAGYQNKVPWPKNAMTKGHPPIQSKDRYTVEPTQLFHSHGANRENFSEPGPNEGARSHPIVVEEHERQPSRGAWGNWSEQSRPPQRTERSQTIDYAHPAPPPAATHSRPPPNPPSEHYAQPPTTQAPPPQRQHRIYHHTPQTMSQVVNNSPVVTVEPAVHHQAQAPVHQGPSTGPPVPPPPHYHPLPPQRQERSEKDKMLNGEPFNPYDHNLLSEREHCSNVVFRFNMTSNERVQITRGERHRHFQALVAAKWIPRPDMDMHYRGSGPYLAGHVGVDVFVDTPFHCDYGYNLVIGDMVTIGPGCRFMDSGRITINRNARICANVTIDTQRVPTDSKSVKGSRGTVVAAEVTIGENVYIGANAVILGGVKIGTGAIIHPGSVVMKDVPRDCVARGNPANVSAVNWDD